MSNSQPLVFTYFKLPPNHEHFLRIHEVLGSIFVPQLANLNSALEAAQVIHPSPQATQVLHDARKAAVSEVETIWNLFQAADSIAQRYLKFLTDLAENDLEGERHAYESACVLAGSGASESEKAQRAMNNFQEGIENAISRIISIMAGDGTDMSSLIRESSKVLAEIMAATGECEELLRECSDDFKKLQKEDFDEASFLRDPSWEELQVVKQKWDVFYKTVASLWVGWTNLKNGIRGAEEDFASPEDSSNVRKVDRTTRITSRRNTGDPPTSTNNPNSSIGRNNSPLATPSHPSLSNKTKFPFLRKVLRRIMPCLSSNSLS